MSNSRSPPPPASMNILAGLSWSMMSRSHASASVVPMCRRLSIWWTLRPRRQHQLRVDVALLAGGREHLLAGRRVFALEQYVALQFADLGAPPRDLSVRQPVELGVVPFLIVHRETWIYRTAVILRPVPGKKQRLVVAAAALGHLPAFVELALGTVAGALLDDLGAGQVWHRLHNAGRVACRVGTISRFAPVKKMIGRGPPDRLRSRERHEARARVRH